jgi:hypothetical protein
MSVRTVRKANRYVKVSRPTVSGAPVGASVVISCSSAKNGCPFERKTIVVKSTKRFSLAKRLEPAKLRDKAKVQVLVTKPGFIGSLFRYTIRIGQQPKKATRCVKPGQTTPHTVCS